MLVRGVIAIKSGVMVTSRPWLIHLAPSLQSVALPLPSTGIKASCTLVKKRCEPSDSFLGFQLLLLRYEMLMKKSFGQSLYLVLTPLSCRCTYAWNISLYKPRHQFTSNPTSGIYNISLEADNRLLVVDGTAVLVC